MQITTDGGHLAAHAGLPMLSVPVTQGGALLCPGLMSPQPFRLKTSQVLSARPIRRRTTTRPLRISALLRLCARSLRALFALRRQDAEMGTRPRTKVRPPSISAVETPVSPSVPRLGLLFGPRAVSPSRSLSPTAQPPRPPPSASRRERAGNRPGNCPAPTNPAGRSCSRHTFA